MTFFRKTSRGVAAIEYAVLITIIVGALYVMRPYIQRVFNGFWKKSGDSFGHGRQYEAAQTHECGFGLIDTNNGVWYNSTCYQQAITLCKPGDITCENKEKTTCARPECCEEAASTAGIKTNCN